MVIPSTPARQEVRLEERPLRSAARAVQRAPTSACARSSALTSLGSMAACRMPRAALVEGVELHGQPGARAPARPSASPRADRTGSASSRARAGSSAPPDTGKTRYALRPAVVRYGAGVMRRASRASRAHAPRADRQPGIRPGSTHIRSRAPTIDRAGQPQAERSSRPSADKRHEVAATQRYARGADRQGDQREASCDPPSDVRASDSRADA